MTGQTIHVRTNVKPENRKGDQWTVPTPSANASEPGNLTVRRSSGRNCGATATRKASSRKRGGAGSVLETLLYEQVRQAGLPLPERQVALVPSRRFRHDFYWPSYGLAVEVNGGTWIPGTAHSNGAGIERDYEKAALTALAGVWTLFVSGRQVRSGQALAWISALITRNSGSATPNE
jgi:hypothetical protein